MIKSSALCVGLTQTHTCGYLNNKDERLAVILEPELHSVVGYNSVIQDGFRRSGETLYRPQCPNCNACESLRVNVEKFTPSKSQKRQLKQLAQLQLQLKTQLDDNWFAIYDDYISQRHRNGSMYPADKERFLSFIQTAWQKTQYLHLYQNEKLIAVAVTDILPEGWSAIYSFFTANHAWSLGTLCVLAQLQLAKQQNIPWLYLGFQIDQCNAMKYKKDFKPHQRYINEAWQNVE